MEQKTNRLIRWIYGIVLGAYTVVIGVLFIVQCLSIYHSAESNPYTVDSISTHFSQISPFIWVWFVLFVSGFVMECFLPKNTAKEKIGVPQENLLKNAKARLPKDEITQETWQQSATHTLIRRIVWFSALGIFALSMVVCAVLLFLKTYTPFADEKFYILHDALVSRLIGGLPFMMLGILVCVGAAIVEVVTVRKETQAFKAATAAYVKQGGKLLKNEQKTLETSHKNAKFSSTNIVRIVLATVGVVLVVFGIFNGGVGEVFLKAINICTQCIGLG